MKKLFFFIATALVCFACNESKTVTVTVTNPTAMERTGEMVEISMSDVNSKLQLADTAQIIVLDVDGQQVPYQITYDEKVIFPVTVKANGTAAYTIQAGVPAVFDTKACGRYYPERVDDVAKIDELKKTDPKAASELYQSVSYHVDHGNGLDCYKVGPTLGGGTAALMVDNEIIYPYCYATQEILDNGPLRFTVKLVYNPLTVKENTDVVETRLISLDAGSHMNKTVVSYSNLKDATPVVTGIVLHEPDGAVVADAANGYITYVDPTDNVNNNNGKIFVGAAFPATVKEAKVVLFPEKEKTDLRGGADGHVLAVSDYEPGSEYTYYWGSAWDKADIKTADAWNEYVAAFAQKLRAPLTVTMQ